MRSVVARILMTQKPRVNAGTLVSTRRASSLPDYRASLFSPLKLEPERYISVIAGRAALIFEGWPAGCQQPERRVELINATQSLVEARPSSVSAPWRLASTPKTSRSPNFRVTATPPDQK